MGTRSYAILSACALLLLPTMAFAEFQEDLRDIGLTTISDNSGASCAFLALDKTKAPLIRQKSDGQLHAFGLGSECPKTLQTPKGSAHVLAFSRYAVMNRAFIGYRPNGKATKIVKNFIGRKRGVSRYQGFRYIFYNPST